jgi:hypothetical protein
VISTFPAPISAALAAIFVDRTYDTLIVVPTDQERCKGIQKDLYVTPLLIDISETVAGS